jgi:parallel beta-helix repeat protein
MYRIAVFFATALILGATTSVPVARAQTPISACQTISQPGSYVLEKNLSTTGNCLVITASFVTIDLAGFSISGTPSGTGILGQGTLKGIAIRNGSVSNFDNGIDLSNSSSSIVEGLRVIDNYGGILASGSSIVTGNLVFDNHLGIDATGTVSDNISSSNHVGIEVQCPSNVLNNTATNNLLNLDLVGTGCNSVNNVAP